MTRYTLYEDEGGIGHDVTAPTIEDAYRLAREWAREGDWDTSDGTIWVDVHMRVHTSICEGDYHCQGESCEDDERRSIAIHPDEPPCDSEAAEHDWQSPIELVGGIESNPGVQGHGGGVYVEEVCMHCGCGQTTDSWAQRRDTGEQGLTSVSYQKGRYRDELAELAATEEV